MLIAIATVENPRTNAMAEAARIVAGWSGPFPMLPRIQVWRAMNPRKMMTVPTRYRGQIVRRTSAIRGRHAPLRHEAAGASRALDNHRDRVAAAEAHGREAPLRTPVPHRVHERREDARPAAADWVAHGHRAAVHVLPVVRDAELVHHRDARRRIGLVVLEEIDVVDGEPGPLQ